MLLLATSNARAQSAPTQSAPSCHDEDAAKTALESPLPVDRKSVLLRAILEELTATSAPFLGEGTLRALNLRIAALRPGAAPADVMQLYTSRGDELLQVGRIEDAIKDYERMTAIAKTLDEPRTLQFCLRRLGLAWMRLGERQNCVARHNADSCLLPLKEGAVHVDRKGSETAIRCFSAALQIAPDENTTVWLLNLAHMTLGSWPDGVPARWRIPKGAFAPEYELPRMFDVAPKLGLATPDRAGGAAFDDFTGDGLLDLVTSSLDLRQRLRFFEQKPDATFVEVGVKKGLAGVLGGLNLMHFDANNDGRLDLLVLRGGWMGAHGRIPSSLLIQQADGTFVDRTLEAGIEISAPTQAGAVADIDNDGDLDLFLGYEDLLTANSLRFPSRLFLNRGDGTFENWTQVAGVGDAGFVKGAAFADYDRDGLPDLYVSTMRGPNHLYRNEGGGKFRDVAAELGVTAPEDGFSCFFFDYDNDGHLDLLLANGHPDDMIEQYSTQVKYKEPLVLFRQENGKLRDVSAEAGPAFTNSHPARGLAVGDLHNHGRPDVVIANNGAAPVLLKNTSGDGHHWVGLTLQGTACNRDAIGARLTWSFGGQTRRRLKSSGGSYLSSHDPREILGIGTATTIDWLEIVWPQPSGRKERFTNVPIDRYVRIVEGRGKIG